MFAALTARLIYVEVVNGPKLQARALEQWYRDVPLQGERGAIYDATGRLLADSRTVYTVYVRPVSVTNKEETASILSSALGLDYEVLLSKLNSRVSEITVKKNVEKDVMLAIASSAATGVYGSQSIKRIYPYGNYLTQILGFTNVDGEGQTGIEKYYDQYLRGRDGYVLTATDLIGRELENAETYYVPGSQGATTYLTVDGHIQSFAESAVEQAMLTYQPKGASCIVMNVNTGAILAMAQRPSFDLNEVPRDNVAELLQNSKSSLISGVFEPGSTFKIITSAIGLDTGAISRDHAVYCPGYRMVDGQRIKCWRTIGHGSQTFDEGVQNSCNCLFMDAALAIGTDTFYDRIRAFGLTSKTGVDMSGEASGLTIPQESVKTVDLARMGFGQAIAVTPLELVRAAAAVVNGGKLVTPYLVDRIVGMDGSELYRAFPATSGGVISAETSAAMRELSDRRQDGYGTEVRKRRDRTWEIRFDVFRVCAGGSTRVHCADDRRRTARRGVLRQSGRRAVYRRNLCQDLCLSRDGSRRTRRRKATVRDARRCRQVAFGRNPRSAQVQSVLRVGRGRIQNHRTDSGSGQRH